MHHRLTVCVSLFSCLATLSNAKAADLPQSEKTVCEALSSAKASVAPLEDDWSHPAGDNDMAQSLSKQTTHQKLDEAFSARNKAIYAAVGARLHVEKWSLVSDETKLSTYDFGTGARDYVDIKAHIDCEAGNINVVLQPMEAKPELVATLSHVKVGDRFVVSGRLLDHDRPAQRIEDAIEWGGPLWGPFGGLWIGAFDAPEFHIKVTALQSEVG